MALQYTTKPSERSTDEGLKSQFVIQYVARFQREHFAEYKRIGYSAVITMARSEYERIYGGSQ